MIDADSTMRRDADSDRGQTTIDFGIGVSVFLLTIIFIFVFVPSLFQPFVTDQSQAITADRIADEMVEDALLAADDDAEPYLVEYECVEAFFEMETADEDDYDDDALNCRFDTTVNGEPNSPYNVLGINENVNMNFTLEEADGSEMAWFTGHGELHYGDEMPPRGNVVTSQRVIHLEHPEDGADDYRLFVRVW